MKVLGTVWYEDLDGGVWVLVGDDGRRWQLSGGDGGLWKEGQRVEVEGEIAQDLVGLGMAGPVLLVSGWRPV